MTRDNLDLPVPPLRDLTALVYRYPVKEPVMTSFGAMHNRPAVFVRAEAEDGTVGWGEIWCNFPSVGAEHRARLVNQLLRPLLIGREFASPATAFQSISARTAVLALQCAEPGPFAQAIAGIDTALWDLVARRAQEPLWHLMGGIAPRIPVYASGINPTAPATRVAALLGAGHRAFKLKIGFSGEGDRQNLAAIRATIGRELTLATDANQAWTVEQALAELPHLAGFALAWLEEPIRADRPWSDWLPLAAAGTVPLAGGENLASDAAFDAALEAGVLSVVQPDLAKWGGLSACLPLGRRIRAAGKRYCPHYLGAGIGLLASAHLLAAVGGDGLLEIDINENPLRDLFCGPITAMRDGYVTLNDAPGLGIEPDLAAIARYAIAL